MHLFKPSIVGADLLYVRAGQCVVRCVQPPMRPWRSPSPPNGLAPPTLPRGPHFSGGYAISAATGAENPRRNRGADAPQSGATTTLLESYFVNKCKQIKINIKMDINM